MDDDNPELRALNDEAAAWRAASTNITPYLTPTNLREERLRFIEAPDRATPQFTYRQPTTDDLERVRSGIVHLQRSEHPVTRLALGDLEGSLRVLEAFRSRDGRVVSAASTGIYGAARGDLLASAYATVESSPLAPDDDVPDLTVEAVRPVIETSVALLGPGWSVIADDGLTARIAVRSASQEVVIRSSAVFSRSEVKRLVVHEVGCHVQRAMRGQRQPLAYAGLGLGSYLETEEGLAVWLEERYGLLDGHAVRRYALRYIAACRAETSGWQDVCAELLAYTGVPEAFDIAARVKRGLVHTAESGAWTKDRVYWQGMASVAGHLAANPADLDVLLSGKFAISDLAITADMVAAGYVRVSDRGADDVTRLLESVV